ncbi:hypothetical protein DMC30DRAFT_405040 [Rhodotorula diobovata]|uniref:Uncharacterized protein n=1 Tax=Rhodotorula diobovata TaxID=5288 RepID=A0A5C5FPK6_9BASI|nr:hypothetical protein DMC30DRAFT_405040 [Rhodotorula diobovata]
MQCARVHMTESGRGTDYRTSSSPNCAKSTTLSSPLLLPSFVTLTCCSPVHRLEMPCVNATTSTSHPRSSARLAHPRNPPGLYSLELASPVTMTSVGRSRGGMRGAKTGTMAVPRAGRGAAPRAAAAGAILGLGAAGVNLLTPETAAGTETGLAGCTAPERNALEGRKRALAGAGLGVAAGESAAREGADAASTLAAGPDGLALVESPTAVEGAVGAGTGAASSAPDSTLVSPGPSAGTSASAASPSSPALTAVSPFTTPLASSSCASTTLPPSAPAISTSSLALPLGSEAVGEGARPSAGSSLPAVCSGSTAALASSASDADCSPVGAAEGSREASGAAEPVPTGAVAAGAGDADARSGVGAGEGASEGAAAEATRGEGGGSGSGT